VPLAFLLTRTDLPAAGHRSARADPGVRLADGAGVRVRRVDGTGRLLFALGERPAGRRAVERLFAREHRGDRRTDARSSRVPLFVRGVEEPGIRRRGSGARRRRQSAARRLEREPADDDAGAPLTRPFSSSSSASRSSACRGAGRPRGAPRSPPISTSSRTSSARRRIT
jgi:hypothetical protein